MIEFWRFKAFNDPNYYLIEGEYNLGLVVLSVLVSSFAAYSLLVVIKQTKQAETKSSVQFWQLLGSSVFGLGVWAMHFTGMLAFKLPVGMSLDGLITAISIFPSMIGCYLALQVMYYKNFTFWSIQLEGLLIAIGIGTMHYLGMEAMILEASMVYDFPLFLMSILSAHLMAILSIYLMIQVSRFYDKKQLIKLVSSCVMGGAVASMHYVAMASVSFFVPVDAILIQHESHTDHLLLSLNIAGVIIVLVSVTVIGALVEHRLRKAEKSVAESVLRERDIVEHLPDGLITIDQQGLITRANPMAYSMFEYTEGKLPGLSIEQIIPSISNKRLLEDSQSTHTEILNKINSYEGIKSSGKYFPIEASFSTIKLSEYQPNIFNCTIRDITSRVQLEQQLRHAHKLESIGQLASGIAHEINTPTQYVSDNTSFLNSGFQGCLDVIAATQTLIQEDASRITNEQLNDIKELIENNDIAFYQDELPLAIEQSLEGLGRITKIIGAMKSFSHSNSGKLSDIDIAEAIESTATVSRGEWKYIAELSTDFEHNLPRIPCYRDELNQVVLNCIINASHAIKDKYGEHAGQKGHIAIKVRKIGSKVVISITDDGSGMSDEVKRRIFDPFFTTKGVGKGTGQGLSMAYNVMVEMHKGHIQVDSVDGEGTTFELHLPLERFPEGTDRQVEQDRL